MQAAFIEHDALQCGFCTPGQILAGIALLSENPNPTEDDVRRGMSGNLCRCGAYPKILRAVLATANNGDAND
jgi:aerobic-type carbon monoxide dehydrogenase small subunit (CoxS/CutS family)